MTNKVIVVTKLTTKNDTNGNPRRLYIVTEIDPTKPHFGGTRLDIIDEGYNGHGAFREKYPNAVLIQEIAVALAEYRRWMQVKKADEKSREEEASN